MTATHRLIALTAVSCLVLAGCSVFRAEQRPASNLEIEATPERVARGKYLANNVMDCMGCHTPYVEGTHLPDMSRLGAGGNVMGPELGAPVKVPSANISSDIETGLGDWTDGEILRAMREGISKDGTPLFPIMPYGNYRDMSDEDAYAIIAYLRTLPAVKNDIPARELGFPFGIIVNFIPKPVDKPVPPAPEELIARGAYLTKMAGCAECHTQMNNGRLDMSKYMAGGHEFIGAGLGPDGKGIKMPNITPDLTTGIGSWTDDQIADAVRIGRRPDGKTVRPPMPWFAYNGMTDDDIEAMVAYLRTVPAVKNDVGDRW